MMNFKYIKTVVSICVLGGLVSCSIDNIQPINQLTEDNVITNGASAESVLNRIYNRHRSFEVSAMASATGFYGVELNEVYGVFGSNGFQFNNVPDDSELLSGIYKAYYAIINDANFFIKLVDAGNTPDLTEERVNEMLAEARFFRAHSHFSLLRTFGEFYDMDSQLGIVVSLDPITDSAPMARSSVRETYEHIISDLEFAVAHAGSNREHFYVSATTAQALLAKVNLYMGNYDASATQALGVINNVDNYSLAADYASVFNERWGSETLFAPYVDGYNEEDAFTTHNNRINATYAPSPYFMNVADASDGAIDSTDFFGFPNAGYDSRYIYAFSLMTQGNNGNAKYPFDYYDADGSQGNTMYYLRMSEMYLIYAEAEARRPGGILNDGIDRLNDVRLRAGVPPKTLTDQATLLNDIRDEKMLELFTENAESYYDLVRYDILGDLDATDLKPTLTRDKFMFPIPAAALAGNSLLIPNK